MQAYNCTGNGCTKPNTLFLSAIFFIKNIKWKDSGYQEFVMNCEMFCVIPCVKCNIMWPVGAWCQCLCKLIQVTVIQFAEFLLEVSACTSSCYVLEVTSTVDQIKDLRTLNRQTTQILLVPCNIGWRQASEIQCIVLMFQRRCKDLAQKGIHFVGSGVSGGEDGARYGPSLMPGGTEAAWWVILAQGAFMGPVTLSGILASATDARCICMLLMWTSC